MKVLIVAGGTGGHLYPGLAVARALPGHEVLFVVRRGDIGYEILKKEGFSAMEIEGQGLPRRISLKWLTFPFKFLQGWFQAMGILRRFKPDWVVGMGGSLSVPMILSARLFGVRILLHEQNVFPGLANRFLSRWADSVAVSFPASLSAFPMKGKNAWVSGLPVRPEIGRVASSSGRKDFGLKESVPVVLVFGGSLGAQRVNTLAVDAFAELLKRNFNVQVIHITGPKEYERVMHLYKARSIDAKVVPYCHEMSKAYAAADAVVCRAGASTIAELMVVQRPALLIPYPYASNNHQQYNAQVLVNAGLGEMVLESDLQPSAIADFLVRRLQEKRSQALFDGLAPDASSLLAAFLRRRES